MAELSIMLGIVVSSIFLSFALRLDAREGGVYAEEAKGFQSPIARKHIDEEAMEANHDCSTEGHATPMSARSD